MGVRIFFEFWDSLLGVGSAIKAPLKPNSTAIEPNPLHMQVRA